jgi:hypothetical protein
MPSIVHDFKSINKILNRQEQKAEFEAKNPEPLPSMYAWPAGVAVPYGGSCESVTIMAADLPPYTPVQFNEQMRKLYQQIADNYALTSEPKFKI